jgi:cbb3-type cytochrome oxidase subunit 3
MSLAKLAKNKPTFLKRKLVMKYEMRKKKILKTAIFVILLFIVGICMIAMLNRPQKTTAFAASANTYFGESYYDDFEYLSGLERAFRYDNPNATPEEALAYLENEISNLSMMQGNFMSIMSTSSGGTYKIFGRELTGAEIGLSIAYPAQAIMAANAATDAVTKMNEFYEGSGWLDSTDAFRHAYWNALMEKRISKTHYVNIGTWDFPWYVAIQVDFPKLFADAHEDGQTGLDPEMDLLNNAIGRGDAVTFSYLNEAQLATQIMTRVSFGHYWKIDNAVFDSNHKVIGGTLVPISS